ncbi:hypothetical protein TwortDSMZ_075 [Staphylococcus phage Twort]|uniref:Uncharacterized protein n=1 Tax=Staphylococcus phage Twort (strain DSM 17442 / HER 48) TaxID=2908167 RepID=A0A6H0X5N1_BPTWO|nr:hypothetical protein TwortDSMZ_075 [Staphylococcus phage Twort]
MVSYISTLLKHFCSWSMETCLIMNDTSTSSTNLQ